MQGFIGREPHKGNIGEGHVPRRFRHKRDSDAARHQREHGVELVCHLYDFRELAGLAEKALGDVVEITRAGVAERNEGFMANLLGVQEGPRGQLRIEAATPFRASRYAHRDIGRDSG